MGHLKFPISLGSIFNYKPTRDVSSRPDSTWAEVQTRKRTYLSGAFYGISLLEIIKLILALNLIDFMALFSVLIKEIRNTVSKAYFNFIYKFDKFMPFITKQKYMILKKYLKSFIQSCNFNLIGLLKLRKQQFLRNSSLSAGWEEEKTMLALLIKS